MCWSLWWQRDKNGEKFNAVELVRGTRPDCRGSGVGTEPGDWQQTLEAARTEAEEKELKHAWRGGEGEVAWGEEKRKSREREKQTWRRWGIDEAESWVIPAVNLCVFAFPLCVCEYEWQALAVNETVYQINMAIISQMTVASTEEQP